jgi:hypothetical protein
MAKAPRPGRVKTRLVPPLSHDEACAMSAGFLRDITDNIALAARDAKIAGYVAFAPEGQEALFDGIVAPGTQFVLADGTIEAPSGVLGFGGCLLHAAQALFAQGYDAACLLNSDSPTLPTALLVQAAEALAEAGDRVVLGPADDGGYYIIGMKAPHAGLFADIAWSTEHVAEQTRERARSLGLELVELATWYDVDDAAALARLMRDVDRAGAAQPGRQVLQPYAAPVTASCLQRLRLDTVFRRAAAG